jgi:lysophospholipase L1-like esterase
MKNLSLLLGAVVFALLLLEGVLRLFYAPPPIWRAPQVQHLHSPLLGWVLPANTRHFFSIDVPVSINSAGLRDDEIPMAKPPGQLRILALGDSFTFALGVAFEDLWVQRLERLLAEETPGRGVQVINAAVAGYNTRQELIYVLAEGLSWQPDAIIVAFYWNDLLDNEPALPDPATTPRLAPDQETLSRDQQRHTLPPWLRDGLRRSLVLYLSVNRAKGLWAGFHPDDTPLVSVQRALLGNDEAALAPYLRATETRLLEIASAARERHVPVVLVYFPDEAEVVRPGQGFPLASWLEGIWAPTGMPFVDLGAPFVASRRAGANPFLPYDLHPNATGMDLAARALLPAIASLEQAP